MGPFHVEFASVGEVHGELVGCHDVTVGQGAERIVHGTSRSSEAHPRANGVGIQDLHRPSMSLTPAAPQPRDPTRRDRLSQSMSPAVRRQPLLGSGGSGSRARAC